MLKLIEEREKKLAKRRKNIGFEHDLGVISFGQDNNDVKAEKSDKKLSSPFFT